MDWFVQSMFAGAGMWFLLFMFGVHGFPKKRGN